MSTSYSVKKDSADDTSRQCVRMKYKVTRFGRLVVVLLWKDLMLFPEMSLRPPKNELLYSRKLKKIKSDRVCNSLSGETNAKSKKVSLLPLRSLYWTDTYVFAGLKEHASKERGEKTR